MNIYAKEWDRVIFKYPSYGYISDQKQAKKYLKEGEIYIVDSVDVHNFHSIVYLKGIEKEGKLLGFNTIHFEDVKELWIEKYKEGVF